jgi:hypothetical protein
MSTYTWLTGVSGDWNTPSLWAGGIVPDSVAADVSIVASGTYAVTIAAGETETVNQLTLLNGANAVVVQGDLRFAGTLAASLTEGTGSVTVAAGGLLDGTGLFAPLDIVNNGTLAADAGADDTLEILATVTNDATVVADDGVLEIGALSNLSGSVLAGGTYIASGFIPADANTALDNILLIALDGNAGLTVDAATIVLDGPASQVEVYDAAGDTYTLEQELRTIAAGGTLAILDGRGYRATSTLLDAGSLVLGGNTLATGGLTIAAGGTLSGYGDVAGALSNSGAIIASGGTLGTLILAGAVSGDGAIQVQSGSELIMAGGTVGALTVNGAIYDAGTLLVTGTVAGGGTIVVEHGGALEFGGAASAALVLSGDDVTVTLDDPTQFGGTLSGFGLGNTLVLDGLQGSSADVVNGNTLVVLAGGTTVDTVVLGGNDAGATFSAVTSGTNTVVTNIAGAPARDDMPITLVSVSNTIGVSASLVAEIENELTYAADNWGQYITGAAPLRVSLTFVNAGAFGSEIASGSPGDFISNGETIDGHAVYVPDSLYTLETGDYASGTSTDIAITLVASTSLLSELYINTDPAASTAVPAGEIDLLSVLTHEFGHGLGFIGLINRASPTAGSPPVASGAPVGIYDTFVSYSSNGATFDGPNAEAAYGALINAGSSVPVPLYDTSDASLYTENFYHLSGSVAALSGDLMESELSAGTYLPISNLDLAILKDTGVPVTASVTCYAKGTRIRTPRGDVAIEDLRPGDPVVTARGEIRPVVWTGNRHVDCRRHPHPERVLPVRISAHAFGRGLPCRDLVVSPNHAIYFDCVFIPARLLVNGTTVDQVECAAVDYYHLELSGHDVVLAEGLPAESYLDCGDRWDFANNEGAIALFADFLAAGDNWETNAFAPLKLHGPEVDAARALVASALRDRAA